MLKKEDPQIRPNKIKRNKSIGLASLIIILKGLCNILCYVLNAYLIYVNIYTLKLNDYIIVMFNTVLIY